MSPVVLHLAPRGSGSGAEASSARPVGAPGFELLTEATTAAAIEQLDPDLVVSPGPRDCHPAHLRVAAQARGAIEARAPHAPRWWFWSLWGCLERPTLATGFEEERLREILTALAAYGGELARNDFRRLVRGRAEANACLAPELLFGFGATDAARFPFAELLTELAWVDGAWRHGRPRLLDPADPFAAPRAPESG